MPAGLFRGSLGGGIAFVAAAINPVAGVAVASVAGVANFVIMLILAQDADGPAERKAAGMAMAAIVAGGIGGYFVHERHAERPPVEVVCVDATTRQAVACPTLPR